MSINNKNNSFFSFLENLADEIEKENEMKKSYKKIEKQKPFNTKKKSKSIIGYLNDMVENMDRNFGDVDFDEPQKSDLEAQRKLKAELRNKHADKFKKASEKKPQGDSKARERLKEAQKNEKIDKIREEMAKEKNRKRLKDAFVMAEILGPPVSKRG